MYDRMKWHGKIFREQQSRRTVKPERGDQFRIICIPSPIGSIRIRWVIMEILPPFQIPFVLSSAPMVARELLLTRQTVVLATQAGDSILALAAYKGSKSSLSSILVLALEHILFKLELELIDHFL